MFFLKCFLLTIGLTITLGFFFITGNATSCLTKREGYRTQWSEMECKTYLGISFKTSVMADMCLPWHWHGVVQCHRS